MGSPRSIPADASELTLDWMQAALAPLPAPTAIEVEPLDITVGFMGDLARVVLHYDTGGRAVAAAVDSPASVIVKFPPADPGGRHVGSMLNAFDRERAFYAELAPRSSGARVPHCHHAAGDHEAGRWVLVLEDCPSDPLDTAAGATLDQMAAAVDALADFHRQWWRSTTVFEWMPGFDRSEVGGLRGAWLDAIPRFTERYGHLCPGDSLAWLSGAAQWLPTWSDRAADEPLTVVHADYRLDNLRYHQGRVTMIDWQTALRGPGAMDLTSLVATGLNTDDRRAWESDLIDRYRSALTDGGVTVDDGWLTRSYDETLLWWMGQFANNISRLEPDDPAAQAALDTTIERVYTAAADRDLGRLVT